MKRPSKEERKRALADQTKTNASNKDSGGGSGKNVFDFSRNNKGKEISKYKVRMKKNKIDIIPYIIGTDNHPGGMKKGYDSYVLNYWVHYNVGPMEDQFLCLKNTFRKPCPICEERARIISEKGWEKDPEKKALAGSLKPKQRVMYNVIDLMGESDEIRLFEVSHYLFEKELLEQAGYDVEEDSDLDYITFADLEDGRTVIFRGVEATGAGGNPYTEFKSFQFEKREPYDEEILEESYSLDKFLIIPTYDEVRCAMLGLDASETQTNDNTKTEEEETSKRKTRRSRRVEKEVEKEVEEAEEAEEEEVRKEKPKSTKRKDKKRKVTKDDPPFDPDTDDTGGSKENTFGKTCPTGHIFGVDNDDTDDCDECDIDTWEECSKCKKEKLGK